MYIVKLIPSKNSKYHFGEGDLSRSSLIFHSHSLFSAIVNNFITLYGVTEFNRYKEKFKKLRLSSLFPAIYKFEKQNISDEILFLPKPMLKLGFDRSLQKEIEENPKEIKKIKFISIGALKEHNEGKLKKITIDKNFLISNEEKEKLKYIKTIDMSLFDTMLEHKVTIDRIKEVTLEYEDKGQLYSVEFIKPFRKNNEIVGFYFLIDFDDINEKLLKKLEAAIRLIQDEGLGGKRSTGAGFFKDIVIDKFKMELDNNSNKKYMTLSITVPKEEEFKSFCSYQLIKISGYISSSSNIKYITKLKKSVYALKEGSICKKPIEGQILDLRPENVNHEILLNGRPILLPITSHEEMDGEC